MYNVKRGKKRVRVREQTFKELTKIKFKVAGNVMD